MEKIKNCAARANYNGAINSTGTLTRKGSTKNCESKRQFVPPLQHKFYLELKDNGSEDGNSMDEDPVK